jgi:hypothetical protein
MLSGNLNQYWISRWGASQVLVVSIGKLLTHIEKFILYWAWTVEVELVNGPANQDGYPSPKNALLGRLCRYESNRSN